MPLPFAPEPIEQLHARVPAALVTLWDADVLMSQDSELEMDSPSLLRAHVFDCLFKRHDTGDAGLRLCIFRTSSARKVRSKIVIIADQEGPPWCCSLHVVMAASTSVLLILRDVATVPNPIEWRPVGDDARSLAMSIDMPYQEPPQDFAFRPADRGRLQ